MKYTKSWVVLTTALLLGSSLADTALAASTTSETSSSIVSTTTSSTSEAKEQTVSGQINWQDANDKFGKRPTYILVSLLKDGKSTGQMTVTSATKNWRYQFKHLEDGHYSVEVNVANGYQATVDGMDVNCVLPLYPVLIKADQSLTLSDFNQTIASMTKGTHTIELPQGSYQLKNKQASASFEVSANGKIQQWKQGQKQTVSLVEMTANDSSTSSTATSATGESTTSSSINQDWGDTDLIQWLLKGDKASTVDKATTTETTSTTSSTSTTTSSSQSTASTTTSTEATKEDQSDGATVEQNLLAKLNQLLKGDGTSTSQSVTKKKVSVKATVIWQDDTTKYRHCLPVLQKDGKDVLAKTAVNKQGNVWEYTLTANQLPNNQSYTVSFPDVPGYTKEVSGHQAVYTLKTKAVRFQYVADDKTTIDPFAFWLEDETPGQLDKIFPNTQDGQFYLKVGHTYKVRSLAKGYKQEDLKIRINPQTYQVEYQNSDGEWTVNPTTTIVVHYKKATTNQLPSFNLPDLNLPSGTDWLQSLGSHLDLSGLSGLSGLFDHFDLSSLGGLDLSSLFSGQGTKSSLQLPKLSLPDLSKIQLPQLKSLDLSSLTSLGKTKATTSQTSTEASHTGDTELTTARHLPQTNDQIQKGLILVGIILVIIVVAVVMVRRRKH